MGTPHKHAEVIKGYAGGKQIQFLLDNRKWVDWDYGWAPPFHADCQYRVKPETIRYRVALFEDAGLRYTRAYSSECMANMAEKAGIGFIRWITDWIEVEV